MFYIIHHKNNNKSIMLILFFENHLICFVLYWNDVFILPVCQ